MKLGLRFVALAALSLACASCGKKEAAWRTYREFSIAPAPAQAAAPMSMDMTGEMPGGGGAAPAGSLAWKTPDGWTESAGAGMRLASFAMGSGAATGLCTIVMLGGDAGGVEANVARWIGQLGAAAPSDLGAFMQRQEKIETADGHAGVAVDLTEFQSAQGESMLAAMLEIDGSTAFIKLTGPVGLLKQEKQKFVDLCRSARKP